MKIGMLYVPFCRTVLHLPYYPLYRFRMHRDISPGPEAGALQSFDANMYGSHRVGQGRALLCEEIGALKTWLCYDVVRDRDDSE